MEKTDRSQVIDKTLLIGLKDYGRYATHLYTYTWADEDTQKQREIEIINGKKDSFAVQVIWKIKCAVRNPSLIEYFDKRRGSKLEKIYTLIAYDLLDYGVWHFIKRFISKIRK